MSYEIALDRDTDRGLDRYMIELGDDFSDADAHQLGDWLAAAAQNPTAAFTLERGGADAAAVATLRARTARLRARRRVDLPAAA